MHSHSHHGGHHHNHVKNIGVAILLNFVFSIIEIAAGLLTNSMAVLSDAIHDMGDTIILSFSFFSEKYANKKVDNFAYTYGLTRLPLLSAFVSSVVLLGGSILILTTAIPRLFHPELPHIEGMFAVAVLGVVVNGAAAWKMQANEGINSKVLTLHFIEDILGWAAVLIISVVMKFYPLAILDPILSIAITLYILFNVFINLFKSIKMFIQSVPEEINAESLQEEIEKMKEVEKICDMHIWTLDSIHHIFTAHIRVGKDFPLSKYQSLRNKIRRLLEKYGSFHTTIEIELNDEHCGDRC